MWGISSDHYSCTSMVISIFLLSTTQWNLIKLIYTFLIWIDENDSSVYNYVITHSKETKIVDLYKYSKSEKFTPFSQDLHWGIPSMLQIVSEPQVQTLWQNGPTHTQVSCVLSELLFMKMVCIRVYRATCKLKKVKF